LLSEVRGQIITPANYYNKMVNSFGKWVGEKEKFYFFPSFVLKLIGDIIGRIMMEEVNNYCQ
jgi:hypothetical protein